MRRYFLLLCFLTIWHAAFSQVIIITGVTVIDVRSGKQLPAQSVVIRNDRIESVGPAKKIKIPEGARVIDGSGKFLMPGMTDAHIHFFQSGGLYTRPDVVDLRSIRPYDEEISFAYNNALDYMRRYLRLGITTIIDVGGPFSNFKMRDSIGRIQPAPNVLVTGPLFSMIEDDFFGSDRPIEKVSSEKEADALFEKMLPLKPDFIKIWYIANPSIPAEKNYQLVKYIAETAHRHGLRLAVHATELNTARLAAEAGADILVHSVMDSLVDADFIRLLVSKKITYVPTLVVVGNYGKALSGSLAHHPQDMAWANPFAYGTLSDPEGFGDNEMPQILKTIRAGNSSLAAARIDSIASHNLARLVKAGVNIAAGTDAGNIGTMHASSFMQELEAMAKAGLSPVEIIRSATLGPATGFGKEQLWGTIEKGRLADMVLLDKNPLENIQHLQSVNSIFKNGQPLSPDSIINETAEAVVQRQLNAYNARNIDAFLDTYTDDIELFDYPASLFSRGKEEMRKRYEGFFKNTPNLHCRIEKRIVIGNKIIDKEKVRAGNQTIHAVAIYEVEKGKIRKVTFVR